MGAAVVGAGENGGRDRRAAEGARRPGAHKPMYDFPGRRGCRMIWRALATATPGYLADRSLSKVPVISVVDDDESVRAAMGSLVRSLGYVAHTFVSAEDFLKSPQVSETSCLISDVQMPDMSGVELQSRLADRGSRMPIIFITAFPDSKIEARVLKAGAVCFLSKPCDGATLVKYLTEALQRNGNRSAGR